MFSVISTRERLVSAVLLLALALGLGTARAQSGAGATNATVSGGAEQPLPGQGRVDQFESDIFGPNRRLDLQAPGTDIPLIRRPNPLLTRPDEDTKQKLDAQKNWVFSGMHDLNSKPTLEQMLGMPELGPDGMVKPKLTAMEQYYDDLGKGRLSSSNQAGDAMTMLWTVKQLSSTNPVNPMVFAFPAGDQSLLKTIMTMPSLNHPDGETASDGNASPDTPDSMEAAQAAAAADRTQKHFADGFKQLLGLGPSAPSGAPASFGDNNNNSSLFSPTAAGVYNPTPTPVAAPMTPSSMGPVTGAFNPAPSGGYHPFDVVTGSPAANAAGISFGNTPAPPAQPTSPVSALPIDPFTAYFPKHTH
jgi:hypothetical protein